jgi:hypothetical protein
MADSAVHAYQAESNDQDFQESEALGAEDDDEKHISAGDEHASPNGDMEEEI